ncbi:hypothetical protein [Vibrio sp. 10N.261.46.A3]|uniref:hypothetical protein n=1 Tax=Vibrio sp. 10N.261.46.A3 TaxID=3229658 RepID=UPI00354D4374
MNIPDKLAIPILRKLRIRNFEIAKHQGKGFPKGKALSRKGKRGTPTQLPPVSKDKTNPFAS